MMMRLARCSYEQLSWLALLRLVSQPLNLTAHG